MEHDYFNQRIKCNVTHCKYFDGTNEKCSLGSIEVGVNNERGTCCESFEKNELE